MRCRQVWWSVGLVLSSLGIGTSWGQDGNVQFFPCAEVRFFTAACPEPIVQQEAPVQPPPQALSPDGTALFPPATLSPSTPPLLLQLLEHPTMEHAHAFVAWQRAQLARLREVQALVQQVQEKDLPE